MGLTQSETFGMVRLNSYKAPTVMRVVIRLVPTALIAGLVGLGLMFFLFSQETYDRLSQHPSAVAPSRFAVGANWREKGIFRFQQTLEGVLLFPEVCRRGRQVNEFQVEQCELFKDQLGELLLPAFIPLVLFWAWILVWRIQVLWFYRLIRRLDRFPGETEIASLAENFPRRQSYWEWVFAMRSIEVVSAKGVRRSVWFPEGVQAQEGDRLMLLAVVPLFGELRWVAIHHMPHMAIYSDGG